MSELQAASGAALNSSGEPTTGADGGDGTGPGDDLHLSGSGGGADAQLRGRRGLVLAVAAGVLALDQITKAVAVAALSGQEPVSLLGGLLTLRLVRNPGAAFGLAEGATVLLTLIAVGVTVAVVRLARRLVSVPWAVSFGLLLGGAVGNLVDRLIRAPGPLRGHVVDFLELPHWPVFNVADSAIVLAGVSLVVYALMGLEPEGREEDTSDEDSTVRDADN